MNAWSDDVSRLAVAIIRGHDMSPGALAISQNYPSAVALDIYRNNYRGNLHDALAGAYPVVEQLVGKDFFRLLTRKFIEQHPSRSGNLHRYGAEMNDFVATFPAAQNLVYLSDVAALEWACHCAYFAADAAALDINKLAQVAPEHYPNLALLTHDACHVVSSQYPIAAIWHAHQPGADSDFKIDLESGPCYALVTRDADAVRIGELTQAEAGWLLRIQAGISLGEATSATLDAAQDFDLQATLLNLVSQGVLTDFNLRATP